MARQANSHSYVMPPVSSESDTRSMAVEAGVGAAIASRRHPSAGSRSEASANPVSRLDQHLVCAAQSGCRTAFNELFNLYSRRVHRTILAITKNPNDAEDAMQESFLRAFLAINRFEGRANFYSWLTRIAINSALMMLRRRRSRPEFSLMLLTEGNDDCTAMDFKDTAPNPKETYSYRQRRANLLRAIHRLSPNLREVVLALLEGEYSVREVAERFNISEAAAKSRLYRARTRLGMLPAIRNG